MPRKKKKDPQAITPGAEPTTVAAALEQSPIAETIASHEAQPEPDRTDHHKEAVATFERQREREQAVDLVPLPPRADLPPPQTEIVTSPAKPDRPVKKWAETVRPWSSHGETGVKHVTVISPDMVGIQFDKSKPRTDEEKRDMEAAGLRFFNDAQAWLKTNKEGAFDETQLLAQKFAERRRQMAVESIER
jgi:hypothetical protein